VFEVNRWLPAVVGSRRQSVMYAGRRCTSAVSRRTPAGVGDIATGQFITGIRTRKDYIPAVLVAPLTGSWQGRS
jgi:hypothetical protein